MSVLRIGRNIAILQALFVTFLWSTSWVLIKLGLQDVPPLTFAGLRYVLAFLILLPVAFRRQRARGVDQLATSDWIRLALLGLVYYAITQGAQFVALALLPAVTISLLLNFTTIVVAFLGIMFLGEHLGRLQWLGTFLFIAGAVFYFYSDLVAADVEYSPEELLGLGVTAIGVLSNATSSVLGRSINRSLHISALNVTVISMGVGAATLLASGLIVEGLPSMTLSSWLIIAWLALVNTALAFTLWNHTLRILTAVESSIINNTMMIQIAILAWIFLDETMSTFQVMGLALAAAGALVVQIRRHPTPLHANEERAELP